MDCLLCQLFGSWSPCGHSRQGAWPNPSVDSHPTVEPGVTGPWYEGTSHPYPWHAQYLPALPERGIDPGLDELKPAATHHDQRGVDPVHSAWSNHILSIYGAIGGEVRLVKLRHVNVSGPMAPAARGRFHPIVATSLTIADTRMPQQRLPVYSYAFVDSSDILQRAKDGLLQALYGS